MSNRPTTVLIVGATGSVGRFAVVEALRQGYTVRALVRDQTRAAGLLPEQFREDLADIAAERLRSGY